MNRRSSLVRRRLIVAGFVAGTGFHAWQAMADVGGEAASVAAPGHLSAADYDRAARVLDSRLRGKVRNAATRWSRRAGFPAETCSGIGATATTGPNS
jgi:hypothetical protein